MNNIARAWLGLAIAIAALAITACQSTGGASQPAAAAAPEPITVTEFERDVNGVHLHCFAAAVDLTRVEVLVTAAPENPPEGADALLIATDAWAEQVDADLAVNANFFAWKPQGHADISGLSLSDGQIISLARQVDGRGAPAIVFRQDGTAVCDYIERQESRGYWDGVSGHGGSREHPGSLLVDDGANLGSTAHPGPNDRHPRTAAGVSEDGRMLYLLVVDGRREGWSAGATLPEMAALMIELGAYDAVNLDGGGSSAFVWRREDGSVFTNRPSDKEGFRKVANHLGVKKSSKAAEQRSSK